MSFHSLVPPLSPKYPWFVAQNFDDDDDDHETQAQVFYNLHDPMSPHRCQIPELLGKRIRGYFHGCWVLVSSDRPRDVIWSLWNPITSKIINLPPLNHNGSPEDTDYIDGYCLSAPPEHLNSVLLLTTAGKPNFVYCRLGRRKDLRWTECTYAEQVRNIIGNVQYCALLSSLTCCNGTVYGYIVDANRRTYVIVEVKILVNDRKRKKLGKVVITLSPFTECTYPKHVGRVSYKMQLLGSCTELFLILLTLRNKRKTVAEVKLLKLDNNNMTWEEMEDLKDTVLYANLMTASRFVSPAIASSELGGYIHILLANGGIIGSYHVKEKTISLSSMPYLAGTNHISVWAMAGFFENYDFCRLESDDADSKQENDKDVDICVRSIKGDEDETYLLNLPLHVLEMVMKLSVGVEYLKFRSTCKLCHLAAPLIQWNKGKASKRLQEYSLLSPWAMVFDKHEGIITFTDPLCGDKYFLKTPQELIGDIQIMCSRYGWVLIYKADTLSLVLFNPFTSDIRELPQLSDPRDPPTSNMFDTFSLSAPATSPDCMVAGTVIGVEGYQVCIHFVGREPSWRKIILDGSLGGFLNYFSFCGRDVYASRKDGGVEKIREIGREGHLQLRYIVEAPTSCGTSSPLFFQVKCEQHLLRIIMGSCGESVEVFELHDYTPGWVKINGLGKHTIFICDTTYFCMDAKTPQMENKIYFIRLPIVYYSFETSRFHTFDNTKIEDSFGDLFGTKRRLAPDGWIEPRWL